MNRFLRETWELWYWAMFCPSKLQHRMNEWATAEEKDGQRPNTNSWDILLFRYNFRFVGLAREEEANTGSVPLQRLLGYHLIEETDKGYRFEVPLMKIWVPQRGLLK